ncbi:MAG: hypothetical protein HPY79_05660 [Bacteroidales bacterium]|nr:hypothetical protein [Bacteroidales bacterium]
MFILADSGSTKTTWSIVDKHGHIIEKETIGLNPLHVNKELISNTVFHVTKDIPYHEIQYIHFYGAGCASKEMQKLVQLAIKDVINNNNIFVDSDIYAAAHALLQNQEGWIAILGTGSNLAYYDGKTILKHTPSLGYILGDEGSGSYLGKELLKLYAYKKIDKELCNEFEKFLNLSLNEILVEIYHKPNANRYLANFTYFIKKHRQHPDIQTLLNNAFELFLKTHLEPFIDKYSQNIAFCGSVASIFKEELIQACQFYHLNIQAIESSPMKKLIRYHLNNKRI